MPGLLDQLPVIAAADSCWLSLTIFHSPAILHAGGLERFAVYVQSGVNLARTSEITAGSAKPEPEQRVRNAGIDGLKGALIILVMIGHLFTVGPPYAIIKWVIYGFHMPLFLGLSGYLLSFSKLRSLSVREVSLRYGIVVIPWMFASAVYLAAHHKHFGIKSIFSLIGAPFYHLWYVPAFLILVAVAYSVRVSRQTLAAGGALLLIAGVILLNPGHYESAASLGSATKILHITLIKKLVSLGGFFFIGSLAGSLSPPMSRWMLAATVASFAAIWVVFYYYPTMFGEGTAFLVFNTALIFLIPTLSSLSALNSGMVVSIGRNSLFFYLFHPLPIMLPKKYLYPAMPIGLAMVLAFLGTLVLLLGVRPILERHRAARLLSGLAH